MILKNTLTEEGKSELNKIKEIEKTIHRKSLASRTNEYIYNFQNFRTINTFERDINKVTITLKEGDKDQSDLLVELLNFRKQVKTENNRKKMLLKTYIIFLKVEKDFLMLLIARYFQ